MPRTAAVRGRRARLATSFHAECLCELSFNIPIPQLLGLRSRDDQDISMRAQRGSPAPKKLAHQATYAVAHRSVADFAASCDSEPRRCCLFAASNHDEVASGKPASTPLDGQELRALAETVLARKALRCCGARSSWYGHLGCFGGMTTVSRLRPFALRRLIMLRPPGVFIRARNPCVRFRRLLLGW